VIDDPRDVIFRSLAAPGLDEDDLFAAAHGLPGGGALWGDGRPGPVVADDAAWDEGRERRRRHEALQRKWGPPPRR
jgi:hypothetical protein